MFNRSPWLADPRRSLLLVVDVQEKLLPLMAMAALVRWNIGRLLRAAELLGVSQLISEQYPERLGATVADLKPASASVVSKRMFSCRESAPQFQAAFDAGARQAIVCGLETHVCELQTVADLINTDWQVHLVVDGVCARGRLDHDTALRRLDSLGATLTTTESVLFEWCETSLHSTFKEISQLVRQPPPASVP